MAVSNAWLLKISMHAYAAIGNFEMAYIHAELPERTPLSKASLYCKELVIWQEQHLPLFNADTFLGGQSPLEHDRKFLCIVAYYAQKANTQDYGAIISFQLPARIQVDDKNVCKLPEPSEKWALLATSCFKYKDIGAVPIFEFGAYFFILRRYYRHNLCYF